MRILGVLIVVLIFGIVLMVIVNQNIIKPARRERHLRQIAEENELLDRIHPFPPSTRTRARHRK